MLALEEAQKASEIEEFPVGAVVVSPTGDVLSACHNLTRTLNDPTAHAEILALREAGTKKHNFRLCECDLYVSLEPCLMCTGAISHARIRRLYYALEDEKGGAVSNNIHFFSQDCCFHKPEIYYPFEQEKAKKIISNFMVRIRK